MRSKNPVLMEQIVEYINEMYNDTMRTPTFQEIADKFHITTASVSHYISAMTAMGMLENSGEGRGIATCKIQKIKRNRHEVPVVGTIACGTPILAEQNIESYIYFPVEELGGGKHYALHAKGDSMVNIGVNDGDLVIIREQSDAEEGQIVVALIDNEATLKILHKDYENKKYILRPANDSYSDIVLDDITIQGIAVKVVKNLPC